MMQSLIIIGAGRWGTNIIRTASTLDVRLAVVDRDADALAALKVKVTLPSSCTYFIALSDALVALPDAAVVVATSPATHFAVAKQAIVANRHVLVEKPLCDNLEDAQTLVQLARMYDVKLMVDHLLHYNLDHRKMLALVQSRLIGDITRVSMCRKNFGSVSTTENVLWGLGPHDVSIMLEICKNKQMVSIRCSGQTLVSNDVQDCVTLIIEFDDGCQVQIENNWMHPFKERRTIVYGSEGCVVLNEAMQHCGGNRVVAYKWSALRKEKCNKMCIEKSEVDVNKYLNKNADSELKKDLKEMENKQALQVVLEHFIDSIRRDCIPRTDGDEAVRVLRVLSIADESLSDGGQAVEVTRAKKELNKSQVFIHPTAVVDEGAKIGEGTKIWHFCHIMSGAIIGNECNIGQNVYIGGSARLGKNVKVQNNVSIYDGVDIEDDVFLGPSCVMTNVKRARSHINQKEKYEKTRIKKGATIGANATIVCGNVIGEYAMVGAGSVVTKDVKAHAMVYGNPAKFEHWVGESGRRLKLISDASDKTTVILICEHTGEKYSLKKQSDDDGLHVIEKC